MKNSYFIDIKNSKLFKWFDLIIYALVFILIFSFFLAFVVIKKDKNVSGFKVDIDDKTIMAFDYSKGIDGFTFYNGYKELTEIDEKGNLIECKIYLNTSKADFNLLQIDVEQESVIIEDANCKNKDCVRFHPLSTNGAIICIPHKLVVAPLDNKSIKDIIVG